GIVHRRVVNAVTATQHCVVNKFRGIGKPNPGTKILVIRLGSNRLVAVDKGAWLPRSSWVVGGEGQSRLEALGFVARSIYVPAQAKVEGQVTAKLEVILRVEGIVVLYPAWEMSEQLQVFAVGQSQQEAGKGIPIALFVVPRTEGILDIQKFVTA